MPDNQHTLREVLETLLRDPWAEALVERARAEDPALGELLEAEITQQGWAEDVRRGLALGEGEIGDGAWQKVASAWRVLGPSSEAGMLLAPLLGPLPAGCVLPDELLQEAYPKALAQALHGQDLPLPAWREFLEALHEAGHLTPFGESQALGLWKLGPVAQWFCHHAFLKVEPALRESVWRVYANVCSDYAAMVLHRRKSSRDLEQDAIFARLTETRDGLVRAFDYLISRHRPARARPLLDLLKLLDLEEGKKELHAERLRAWISCHPQGEFGQQEHAVELARAWMELRKLRVPLNSTPPGSFPSRQLLPILAVVDPVSAAEFAKSTRWHWKSDRRRAARLYLKAGLLEQASACAIHVDEGDDGPKSSKVPSEALIDAYWDLAELLLDRESSHFWPWQALECVVWLEAHGGEAGHLLERTLQALSGLAPGLESVKRLRDLLCGVLDQDGVNLAVKVFREVLRNNVLHRGPDQQEIFTNLTELPYVALPRQRAGLKRLAVLALSFLDRDTEDGRKNVRERARYLLSSSYSPEGQREVWSYLCEYCERPERWPKQPAPPLPDELRHNFSPGSRSRFWDFVAAGVSVELLPEPYLEGLAADLGWDIAPFREALLTRAEKMRDAILG